MVKGSFTLGRVAGISINIHISWLIIFVLVTWSLAVSYFPQQYPDWSAPLYWSLGVSASLLFFASVLLHELAHSLVARSRGIPVRAITLFIFGGVSEIAQEPTTPGTELLMALVGPVTSFLLAGFFGFLWLLARSIDSPLSALNLYLASINGILGGFNLIPGFPLDGGRVLRAILWGITGSLERATRYASLVGQGIAYLFILLGIWQVVTGNWINGLWIAFIGWFLDNAAQTSYRQVAMKRMLSGHTVGEAMNRDCYAIAPTVTLERFIHEHILGTGRRCFPVVEGGEVIGLLTLHNVKEVPRERWAAVMAREVMTPLDQLRSVKPIWPSGQQWRR